MSQEEADGERIPRSPCRPSGVGQWYVDSGQRAKQLKRPFIPTYDPFKEVVLDRESPIPLYFQLAQYLEAEIRSGNLNTGDRLENEVKIARVLGLSRPTVSAAFRHLVDKGLVIRRQGYGTVVTEEKVSRSVERSSLFDDLVAIGKKPTTTVLHNELTKPSDLVRESLGLRDEKFVTYVERLRFSEGEPIALMHNFVPTTLVSFRSELLEEHGFYELLRKSGIYPSRANARISAKNATAAEAKLLDEPRGAALLTMERITYDSHGRIIEFAQHVYRASRYALSSTLAITD